MGQLQLPHLTLLLQLAHASSGKNKITSTASSPSSPSGRRSIPKGCLAVKVGQEGEEQQRFIIPVSYFKHPLFVSLLKVAEDEYGFDQQGPITLPCHVAEFRNIRGLIDRDSFFAGTTGARHHGNLVGCFKA